jgi:hypothetical protein
MDEVFAMVQKAGRSLTILKWDIKDAFRTIPVAHKQRWLLGLTWLGQSYHENCLPFGLSTAPYIINLFAETLHWIMQAYYAWDDVVHYLDNFVTALPVPPHHEDVKAMLSEFATMLTFLGFEQKPSKDRAAQVVDVLGIEIDTVNMEARLSQAKKDKTFKLVTAALTTGRVTKAETDTLSGYLSFCSSVVVLGRTFLRRLWDFNATFANPRAYRPLTTTARADLEWWRDFLEMFNGIRLLDDTARSVYHLVTDASLSGMGAFWFEALVSTASWAPHASRLPFEALLFEPIHDTIAHPINDYKVMVIEHAFRRWGHVWRHATVIIHTDSTTAFSGIMDGTLKAPAMDALRQTLLIATSSDTSLQCRWLPSTQNTLADAISRQDFDTVAYTCPQFQPSQVRRLLSTSSATSQVNNTERCSGMA